MKKVIVITGGSDGLGKATAALLTASHDVVILSPTKEKLEAVSQELHCSYQVCDVTQYSQCAEAIEQIFREKGQIDCLINNAGIWIQGSLEENDPKRIADVLAVNTLGTINMTKAVIPVMKKKGQGLILNVISQAGLSVKAERTVYNASKWAITGFTKSLQAELASEGIDVTGLYPGMIRTDMFKKLGIEKSLENGLDPEVIAKSIEFIVNLDPGITMPEFGIKNIKN